MSIRISKEAAEQLLKVVELHGSSILPNSELLLLVGAVRKKLDNFKEKRSAEAKDADRVCVQEPASPRGGLVRAVKRGVDYFA
jgi:hypothetical protein